MEHLGEGIASHFPRIPYIVVRQYDYKGFHTFPDRAGACQHGGKWERASGTHSCPRVGPLACAAAFLQAWLFFGLLAEVVGPAAQLPLEKFFVKDDHRSWWITTESLPDYLNAWKAKTLTTRPKPVGDFVRAQLALRQARTLVSRYCAASSDDSQNWEIDPKIALSFLVLGETLSHTHSAIADLAKIDIPGWLGPPCHGWGYSKAVLKQMKDDNWCPRSLYILQGLFQKSAVGLLYAMRLSHPKQLGLNHGKCDTRACNAREDACRPSQHHLSGDPCSCKQVGPDMQKLIQYIRVGKSVVLKFTADEVGLEVVPHEEGMSFVIISHVWSDGFGNSDGNTLPACRLREFLKVFKRLAHADLALKYESGFDQPQTPIYFWIDTLAIPIGDAHQDERRKAIQNMHKMYMQATCTIVLDAGLMTQERGSSYGETAMKIATCYWITRLWTLQEAYLSKRLFLTFADALVDIDKLEQMDKGNLVSPISLAAQNYRLTLLFQERDDALRSRNAERDILRAPLNSGFLTSVLNALRWRTTSHEQHETLAMAILLGIDTEPFDDAMISVNSDFQRGKTWLDRKMQMLLLEISKKSKHAIPTDLIFLPGPKLPHRGFRWAPRTWLHGDGHEILRSHSSQQTELTPEGLRLNCSGFKLHSISNFSATENNQLGFPTDSSLSTWIVVQDADKTSCSRTWQEEESLAILTRDQEVGGDSSLGLLVAIVGHQENRIHAYILKRVYVRTEVDVECVRKMQKDFQKCPSDAIFGEVLGPAQEWCLDGLEQSPPPILQTSSWGLSNSWLQGWRIRSSMPQKANS